MFILGQRPILREKSLLDRGEEKPFLDHGESPPRHSVAEDGGGNLPPVVTLPIIPRSGKSTKAEKDNECLKEILSLLHSVPCA